MSPTCYKKNSDVVGFSLSPNLSDICFCFQFPLIHLPLHITTYSCRPVPVDGTIMVSSVE